MYTYYVHPLGILTAAIASMILGMVWYSPLLFGIPWMKLVGATVEEQALAKKDPIKKKQMQIGYLGMFIFALLTAYVMGLFIKNMFAPFITDAIRIAVFAWLGFVATSMSGEFLFTPKPKPWLLYVINASYWLVSLILMSVIIFFLV